MKSAIIKLSTTLGVLLLAMSISTPEATAQSDEDAYRFVQRFPATGALQLGLGGTSRAGVADWTTVASNPAGLGWIKRNQFVGSLNNWNISDEATFRAGGASTFDDAETDITRLANVGYVHKAPVARGSLAFAVGYNQSNTFDREVFFNGLNDSNSITDFFMPLPGEFQVFQDPGDDGVTGTDDDVFETEFSRDISFQAFETFAIDFDRGLFESGDPVPFLPAVVQGTVEQSGEVFEEGGTGELSFAAAVEGSEKVMFGAGLNLLFGQYEFSRLFDEFDVDDANDGSGLSTDFRSLLLTEDLTVDMVGVNLRAGMSAEVNPSLRLGLTVESPSYYYIEEDFVTRLETEFDNGDAFSNTLEGTNDYEIITPWRFGGGVAYSIAGLTLSADVEHVDWSQLELSSADDGSEDELFFEDINRQIRRSYDAVVNTSVGLAYDFGAITLRGGYANQPDPRDRPELDRSREYVSAGLGFEIQRDVEINLGWTRERFDDQYAPYVEVANAPVVTEEVTRNRIAVGIRVSL